MDTFWTSVSGLPERERLSASISVVSTASCMHWWHLCHGLCDGSSLRHCGAAALKFRRFQGHLPKPTENFPLWAIFFCQLKFFSSGYGFRTNSLTERGEEGFL